MAESPASMLGAFDAFLREHRRCGWLDSEVDVQSEVITMACDCGAG